MCVYDMIMFMASFSHVCVSLRYDVCFVCIDYTIYAYQNKQQIRKQEAARFVYGSER